MSFFDEADEPRTAPRPAPRRRRTTGGGRRPPNDPQVIRTRRIGAGFALIIAIILIGVLVNSCEVSARNSALKNYNSNVVALIEQSNATSRTFFGVLVSRAGARSIYTSLNQARADADSQLRHVRGLDVPDQDKQAQQYLVLAMQMRRDGIGGVAQNIEQALGGATSKDAVNAIATQMARFYASDVLYKAYSLPLIIGALRSAGIAVGGINGQQLEPGQFLPDIRWLDPTFIASELNVTYKAQGHTKIAPGLHGHSLSSVSVAGTTLQTGSTNTVPASPPPTFTLNFANTGANTETGVVCRVTLNPSAGGTAVSAQTTVPQTTAGQQTTCNVALSAAPKAGSYTLTATIVPVPGEKNKNNNTLSFPVSVQ